MMDDLRKYIIENDARLEDEVIPQGDFERFRLLLENSGIRLEEYDIQDIRLEESDIRSEDSDDNSVESAIRFAETDIHSEDAVTTKDDNATVKAGRRIQFRRNTSSSRRSKPFWRVALIPAAASIALIMIIRMSIVPIMQHSTDSQATGTDSSTAAEAYCRHVENVAELSRSIALLTIDMSEVQAKYVASVVENITRENVPIIDLLPKELSEEKKIHIINDYSNRQIEALTAYKSSLEK